MKPTDPKYIEALAENHLQLIKQNNPLDADDSAAAIWHYTNGAKDILEHTNHAELLEAAYNIVKKYHMGMFLAGDIIKLEKALTKSETSKL